MGREDYPIMLLSEVFPDADADLVANYASGNELFARTALILCDG
jgi:hypothetical protein